MEAVLILRPLVFIVLASVLASSVAVGLSAPSVEVPEATSQHRFRSIGELIAAHSGSHQAPSLEPYTDPVTHARVLLEGQPVLGATPMAWVASARAEAWLALDAPLASRDLVSEVARLERLVGAAPSSPADVASMRAQADALPVELREAFAGLVGVVADAYEVQLPIATSVMTRVDAPLADNAFLSLAERDAMAASARNIVAAQNRFAAVAVAFPALAAGAPLFSDPEGLVVLGGSDADTYVRAGTILDPVLLVDLGGDDTYLTSAGGACPDPVHLAHRCNGLAVSVLLDLAGADTYFYDGLPAAVQGAGSFGGLGILMDLAGDDSYSSTMRRANSGPFFSYIDGGGQGFGQAGIGLLIDAAGADVYRLDVESLTGRSIWSFGQGFGSLGGIGIAADATGDDEWLSNGLGIPASLSGFQGIYVGGVGFYAGIGILSETGGGNDIYRSYNNGTTTDYYALGFAAFAGVGILYEDGGDDDYTAVEIATDPFIIPLLNCAFGTASFGGVGIFLEMSGNDRYYGDTVSPFATSTLNEGYGGPGAAYGLFVDVRGDDQHFMESHSGNGKGFTGGRGVLLKGGNAGLIDEGLNLAGTYLDLGGNDIYTGAAPSGDDSTWVAGADINLPMAFLGVR